MIDGEIMTTEALRNSNCWHCYRIGWLDGARGPGSSADQSARFKHRPDYAEAFARGKNDGQKAYCAALEAEAALRGYSPSIMREAIGPGDDRMSAEL